MNLQRKFAALEMILAIIFGIGIVLACVLLLLRVSKLSDTTTSATTSYITVVEDGEDIFKRTYETVPQHKKTIEAFCGHIHELEKVCIATSDKIPDWKWIDPLKQFPLKFFRPFGEAQKSMRQSIDILEQFNEEKYNHTIRAFEHTKQSLEYMRITIEEINRQVFYIVLLMVFLVLTVCAYIFWHSFAYLRGYSYSQVSASNINARPLDNTKSSEEQK